MRSDEPSSRLGEFLRRGRGHVKIVALTVLVAPIGIGALVCGFMFEVGLLAWHRLGGHRARDDARR